MRNHKAELLTELTVGSPKKKEYKDYLDSAFVILGQNSDLTKVALGKIGEKIFDFINSADKNHPETPHVFMEIFKNDREFCYLVEEVVYLTKTHRSFNISENFHKLINKRKFSKRFIKTDADKFAPRVLKDKNILVNFRKQKRMHVVNIANAKMWPSLPSHFRSLRRNSEPYVEEIQRLQDKAAIYMHLGCDIISQSIMQSIQSLKECDKYYGFNRATLTNVSIIAAKFLGCNIDVGSSQCRIVLGEDITRHWDDMKCGKEVEYEAHSYPFEEIKHMADDVAIQLVNTLDLLPEAMNKPIFDNFVVLVPSFKGADKKLDEMLIVNGYIRPILLGEKDGKCYFIENFR